MAIGDETAEWCDHRAVYSFPLSREWLTWTKMNKVAMSVEVASVVVLVTKMSR